MGQSTVGRALTRKWVLMIFTVFIFFLASKLNASPGNLQAIDMLSEINEPNYNLPALELPWAKDRNGQVKWSGGPHQYGNLDTLATYPTGRGSGLDFSCDCGFEVLAMAGGKVVFAGPGTFGNQVAIEHLDGSVIIYGHLATIDVEVNNAVLQGDTLGTEGNSKAPGTPDMPVHLHIELRDGNHPCRWDCLTDKDLDGNALGGNPIGWGDLVPLVDGYRIASFLADSEGDRSFNYDGSAIKGNVVVEDGFHFRDQPGNVLKGAIARVREGFSCDQEAFTCEDNSSPEQQFSGNGYFYARSSTRSESGVSANGGYLYSSNTPTSPTVDLEYIGQIGGVTLAVAVHDNHAYIGESRRLTILDVTDAAYPTIASRSSYLEHLIKDIATDGDYAYLANGEGGLRIFDVADPANPVEAGFYDTPGQANAVTVLDNYAYVADGDSGLRIVDITDPTKPTEVGFYDTPGQANAVTVLDNYAYVADEYSGLRIISVVDPTNPVEAGYHDEYSLLHIIAEAVDVVGNYAYIGLSDDPIGGDGGGLLIIDVSSPSNTSILGFYDIVGATNAVVIDGDYAYVAEWNGGLRIIDIVNPTRPTEVGHYYTPGQANGLTVVGSLAFVADGSNSLRIIDIANPANPIEAGFSRTPGSVDGVSVVGDYAYAINTDRSGGLWTINIVDPSNPLETGLFDTWPTDHTVVGDQVYVTQGNGGLRIIDVADPANPTEMAFFSSPGDYSKGVDVVGNYAYFTDWTEGMRIISVADPAEPNQIGFYETDKALHDVAVRENYAYVIESYGDNLLIIDVADPSSPKHAGLYEAGEPIHDVSVVGDFAYLAVGHEGLRIIDVADPAEPEEVGFYDTPDIAIGLAVYGDYAYVADRLAGLRIINVADPSKPEEVGYYNTSGTAKGVAVANNYVYVADDYEGLVILRLVGPESETSSISGRITMDSGKALQGVGVSAFFGYNAMTDVDGKYTINDLPPGDYEIRATQPGFTFAPVSVTVPPSKVNVDLIGVSDYEFDTGFRPRPNGYPFSNGDPGWGTYPLAPASGDFTFLDMQRMFGDDVVCRQPDPSGGACISYKLGPALWNRTVNTMISTGGRCVGMSSTSLLYFDNSTLLPPSYNATNDVPLAVGRRPIAYYAAEQLADPVRSHFREQQGQSTPTGTLDQLKQAIESNDPVILNLRQNFAGHAVTPYALDDRGKGIWRVMVYDNNDPNNANLFVEIDETTDRWSYDPLGWEGLRWTHSLYVTSLSLFAGAQTLPFGINDSKELDRAKQNVQTNQIYLAGQGHLLITDSEGNQIGFVGDDFVNEVPGASAITFFGGIQPVEPVYELPIDETFSIQLSGLPEQRSNAQLEIVQFGEGYGLALRNVAVSPSSDEKLIIAPDGTSVAYKSDSGSSEPDIVMAFDGALRSHQFELLGVDVGKDENIIAAVDLTDRQLVFDSSAAHGGEYSIAMRVAESLGEREFSYKNVEIGSGDTHYIDYVTWEDGVDFVHLWVDEDSDGTIDKDYILENQSGVYTTYMPVVVGPSHIEQLAFVSDRDGNQEIYLVNADGSDLERVTNHSATDWAPAWSPDGNWLAFTSDRDGDDDIYIMRSDGTSLRKLTNNTAFDCCADWSPDGTQLAFNSNWPDGDQDIYVVNVDGTGLTNLTDFPGDDWSPAWSPNGSRIAFDARRDGQAEIYVMNADGSGQTRLTRLFSAQRGPDWSPGSQRLVYHSNQVGASASDQGPENIFTMKLDGSEQIQLTNGPADDKWPDWLPSGQKIVFTSYRDGNGDIYAMNSDGSGVTRITNHPADDSGAVWRPQGNR